MSDVTPKKKTQPTTRLGRVSKGRKELTKTVKEIWKYRSVILGEGLVFSIDPSSHSAMTKSKNDKDGSRPGWCVARDGKFIASGVIDLPPEKLKSLPDRLHGIAQAMREDLVSAYGQPDVVIIEKVPLARFGGRSGGTGGGHAFMSIRAQIPLHYSVGIVYGALSPSRGWIHMPPTVWHSVVGKEYEKGDDKDAMAMWYAAVSLCEKAREDATLMQALPRRRRSTTGKAKKKKKSGGDGNNKKGDDNNEY